jgi:hypothetical protein
VSEADIGENVIGTSYRGVLRRYGRPKSVPPEYRIVQGEPCLYYDIVGHDADTTAFLATLWQLCFRRNRLHGAGGLSYIVLPRERR